MEGVVRMEGVALKEFKNKCVTEFKNFTQAINEDELKMARDIILQAEQGGKRLHITGIGKPSHVAAYAASLFSSLGLPTYKLDGTEAVHGSSGQVQTGDVVIAISNSGETQELRYTVETLRNNGAVIIAVTGKEESWLAQNSRVTLLAGVEEEGDPLNKAPRSSILAEIMILQCLSILIQDNKHLTLENYVRWHPGGELGKSIKKAEEETPI